MIVAFSLLLLPFIFAATDSSQETKVKLERLMDRAGKLNIDQIHNEVENIISRLEPSVRKQHETMRQATLAEEKERQKRIRDVLFHLTVPAQQKLVRILMVQENRKMTQDEKRERLMRIRNTMGQGLREELGRHITDKDLYRLAF